MDADSAESKVSIDVEDGEDVTERGEAGTDSRFLTLLRSVSASVGGVNGAAGGGLGIVDLGNSWYSYAGAPIFSSTYS